VLSDRENTSNELCAGREGMDAQNNEYVKCLWMACVDDHFCSMNAV